jgi:2-oxoglutarate dehydrogenase E2 component (dihydrolipoamide succinyltransferase)
MSIDIIVPPLGESVQEATVLSFSKKVGDSVKADELVVELETEKVTLEINAPANGTLSELIVQPGDTVRVGQIIGRVVEGAAAAQAKPVEAVKPSVVDVKTDNNQVFSPAVNRIVNENNLDTSNILGTGKDGRLTKGDVLFPVAKTQDTAPVKQCQQNSQDRETRVKMTKLRQTIARRLKESQNNAAILTTFNEVDMSAVMAMRNEYKDAFEKKHKVKLGFMSFFVKAVTNALTEIPAVNAEINGDEIIYKNYCDIGVAVGTEKGLVVPIIRNAETMNFAEIEKTIYGYGVKARDGQLDMKDMAGGTFTISNGGVYGSLLSTPIINPPQSGILGMHKIQDRPVAINGKVEIRPMMYIALSYDHRIIDGKEAVTFLVKVKEAIEDPKRLVLDV